MREVTEHSPVWRFHWDANGGEREIAYNRNCRRWETSFRVRPGGWTTGQPVDQPRPESYNDARMIARRFAAGHGDQKAKALPASAA